MTGLVAIAEPTRRRIVEMLAEGPLAAGDIAKHFDTSVPAISQHLKVLRESGLVQVRAHAQRRIYELNPEGFAEIDAWLARIRQFWAGRLDALERRLRDDSEKIRKARK